MEYFECHSGCDFLLGPSVARFQNLTWRVRGLSADDACFLVPCPFLCFCSHAPSLSLSDRPAKCSRSQGGTEYRLPCDSESVYCAVTIKLFFFCRDQIPPSFLLSLLFTFFLSLSSFTIFCPLLFFQFSYRAYPIPSHSSFLSCPLRSSVLPFIHFTHPI